MSASRTQTGTWGRVVSFHPPNRRILVSLGLSGNCAHFRDADADHGGMQKTY